MLRFTRVFLQQQMGVFALNPLTAIRADQASLLMSSVTNHIAFPFGVAEERSN
jgi:hypothetical protein